jgi:hypothetical protein
VIPGRKSTSKTVTTWKSSISSAGVSQLSSVFLSNTSVPSVLKILNYPVPPLCSLCVSL